MKTLVWLLLVVLAADGQANTQRDSGHLVDTERLIGWKGELPTTCSDTRQLGIWDATNFGEDTAELREFLDNVNHSRPLPPPYDRHASYDRVLSLHECSSVIEAAQAYASMFGWTRHRHRHYPTTDIPITSIPSLNLFGVTITHSRIMPLIEQTFCLKPHRLSISDIFVVKYSARSDEQASLDPHTDGSQFSFVAALNDGYSGGGTHFVHPHSNVPLTAGSVLVFCGQNKHGALPVTSGVRFLIAGFLIYGSDDD